MFSRMLNDFIACCGEFVYIDEKKICKIIYICHCVTLLSLL